MPLSPDELYLAENCYGYGYWTAPYWFIGLEEGQSKTGLDTIAARAEVFREIGKDGLSDIRQFHNHAKINEKWFKGLRPPTQPTWRYLILALQALAGADTGLESVRTYQRLKWGSSDSKLGETCLIELSGVAANGISTPRDRESRRSMRLNEIYRRLLDNKPKFALVYGRHQHGIWDEFIRGIEKNTQTKLIFVESPTAYSSKGHSKKEYWKSLGQGLIT